MRGRFAQTQADARPLACVSRSIARGTYARGRLQGFRLVHCDLAVLVLWGVFVFRSFSALFLCLFSLLCFCVCVFSVFPPCSRFGVAERRFGGSGWGRPTFAWVGVRPTPFLVFGALFVFWFMLVFLYFVVSVRFVWFWRFFVFVCCWCVWDFVVVFTLVFVFAYLGFCGCFHACVCFRLFGLCARSVLVPPLCCFCLLDFFLCVCVCCLFLFWFALFVFVLLLCVCGRVGFCLPFLLWVPFGRFAFLVFICVRVVFVFAWYFLFVFGLCVCQSRMHRGGWLLARGLRNLPTTSRQAAQASFQHKK